MKNMRFTITACVIPNVRSPSDNCKRNYTPSNAVLTTISHRDLFKTALVATLPGSNSSFIVSNAISIMAVNCMFPIKKNVSFSLFFSKTPTKVLFFFEIRKKKGV